MPKFPTFPTLYDDVLQISITKLKEWGYLEPNQIRTGKISWYSHGEAISSISILVNTHSDLPHVELSYTCNGEDRKYRIELDTIPSNLNLGRIWYFLCPHTRKHCRKLYLMDGYFLHREAFSGCMYECQTHSKSYRQFGKTIGAYLKLDSLYEQLYRKNFKPQYAGKPTRRYLRIIKEINNIESSSGVLSTFKAHP